MILLRSIFASKSINSNNLKDLQKHITQYFFKVEEKSQSLALESDSDESDILMSENRFPRFRCFSGYRMAYVLENDNESDGEFEKIVSVTGIIISFVANNNVESIFSLVQSENIHKKLCVDILMNQSYARYPKAIAGLAAALGAFVLMDSLTMSDGNKFEVIAPFSENRGISLLLKYNKVHILNKCCTSAIFDCLSLMCAKNSRIPMIIAQ